MPNADDTIDLMRFQMKCLAHDLKTRHRDEFRGLGNRSAAIAARCRLKLRKDETEAQIAIYEGQVTQLLRACVPSLMVDCKGDR